MMVYVTAWAISTVLLCIFQCTPISYFWYQDINPGTGHCGVNSTAAEIATNVTSTVADIALVILPLTILFKLQMSTEKKAGLALIFSVGLLQVPQTPYIASTFLLTIHLQRLRRQHRPNLQHDH